MSFFNTRYNPQIGLLSSASALGRGLSNAGKTLVDFDTKRKDAKAKQYNQDRAYNLANMQFGEDTRQFNISSGQKDRQLDQSITNNQSLVNNQKNKLDFEKQKLNKLIEEGYFNRNMSNPSEKIDLENKKEMLFTKRLKNAETILKANLDNWDELDESQKQKAITMYAQTQQMPKITIDDSWLPFDKEVNINYGNHPQNLTSFDDEYNRTQQIIGGTPLSLKQIEEIKALRRQGSK
jgi:hypothetical protein